MCQGPKLADECHIHPEGYSSDQPKPGGSDGMASAKRKGKQLPMDSYPDFKRRCQGGSSGVPGLLCHLGGSDGMASADLCAAACCVDWDALGIDFEEVLSVLNKHGYDARKATMKAIIDAWKSCPEPFIWILRQARSHHLRLKSYIIEQRTGDPSWYLQLPPYIAAMDGHWEIAKSILDHGEDALRAETALHVAVSSGPKNIIFILKLLERLTEADLEAKNINGCTPLDIAARVGNVEAAKVVVEKHSRLLYIPSSNDSFPIHTAFQVNMALQNCPTCLRYWLDSGRNLYGYRFLIRDKHIPKAHPTAFSETSSSQNHESLNDISPVDQMAWLRSYSDYLYEAALGLDWEKAISMLVDHVHDARNAIVKTVIDDVGSGPKSIPLVQFLVSRSTNADLELKNADGCTPLEIAARVGNLEAAKVLVNMHPDSEYIPSSSRKSDFPIHTDTAARYEHKDPWLRYLLTKKGMHPDAYDPKGSGQKLLRLIIKAEFYDDAFALIERVPELGVSEKEPALTIRDFNLVYLNASAFTLCEKAAEKFKMPNDAILLFKQPLICAAENGTQEKVKEITDAFPYVDWRDNGDSLRVAIQNHRWELYMQLPDSYVDKGMQSVEEATKDNILHVAGRLPASDRHRIASGAVLQMQEELTCVNEIESLVRPSYINKRNKDGKTPQEVFTENPKHLMVQAEKRVKDAANSGIVVAGVILAISFAASITVPVGVRADNGRPVLDSETAFKIFGVANTLSFFSACASMLTFLSILSSRYTEGDFLRALPIMKVVVGILSLYMAVASMMVSFTLVKYLMFGPIDEKRGDIIGCAVVVPSFLSVVAMFALGHFSLVAEIIKKTYLSGTLEKRRRSSSFLQKVWTRMRSIAGLWKREGEATIPMFERK